MSNFNCPTCGTAIIDSPRGYIASCEHYPLENISNLTKSQVGIPHEFVDVVKELTSNNLDVKEQGNINGKD